MHTNMTTRPRPAPPNAPALVDFHPVAEFVQASVGQPGVREVWHQHSFRRGCRAGGVLVHVTRLVVVAAAGHPGQCGPTMASARQPRAADACCRTMHRDLALRPVTERRGNLTSHSGADDRLFAAPCLWRPAFRTLKTARCSGCVELPAPRGVPTVGATRPMLAPGNLVANKSFPIQFLRPAACLLTSCSPIVSRRRLS